jgi:hypothetical protein
VENHCGNVGKNSWITFPLIHRNSRSFPKSRKTRPRFPIPIHNFIHGFTAIPAHESFPKYLAQENPFSTSPHAYYCFYYLKLTNRKEKQKTRKRKKKFKNNPKYKKYETLFFHKGGDTIE